MEAWLTVWTDERKQRALTFWNEGFSASQIAADLGGVTRNAVIGVLNRMGAPKRQPTKPAAAGTKRLRRSKRSADANQRRIQELRAVAEAAATELHDLPPDQSPYACGLMDLTGDTCRFPMGDPGTAGFAFCGAKPEPCMPYCSRHAEICYLTPAQRKRDIAEWAVRQALRRAAA